MRRITLAAAAAAALVAAVAPAPAAWSRTPQLIRVAVECQFKNGQNHTVTATTSYELSTGAYRYRFQNMATGQKHDFVESPRVTTVSFPLPAGSYDLKLSFSNLGGTPEPMKASALYENIVVPPIQSTGGKGTGCRF